MQRICFVLQVNPSRIHEYKVRHGSFCPRMRRVLQEAGGSQHSLFLPEMGFCSATGNGRRREARVKLTGHRVGQEWQREMADFFVRQQCLTFDAGNAPLEQAVYG